MSTSASSFSADTFFASQPEPQGLAHHLEGVKHFLEKQAQAGRKVVLITSGGTTVPLEHNVVRFLDNFSAGTRGASSAEHFLRTGEYAVIFMHRQHSLQPFSRHYSHSTHSFLDLIDDPDPQPQPRPQRGQDLFPLLSGVSAPTPSGSSSSSSARETGQLHLSEPNLTPMRTLLHSYKLVNSLGLLHSLTFTTVQEYLFLLRGVSRLLAEHIGPKALYYLAAAVSDFFIPQQKLNEHKIQSGKGSLVIEMDQVPKILKPLVSDWSSSGYIVSFKLETDDDLLIPKARGALERYGHQLVIANSLHRRKYEVALVDPSSSSSTTDESSVQWIRLPQSEANEGSKEIEENIIKILAQRHEQWIHAHAESRL